jgi:hypothetical protein
VGRSRTGSRRPKGLDSLWSGECAKLVYETDLTTRLQRGTTRKAQTLWLQLFAFFCVALIGVGSTVQVCHAHVDSFEASLLRVHTAGPAHASVDTAKGKADSESNASVNCPLCVAMHSALPVAHQLPQVSIVALAILDREADGIDRVFSWRFEMASRPPPAERSRA